MFNPEQFNHITVEAEGSVVALPIPVGEYPAMIEKVAFDQWQSKKDPSLNGMKMIVTWNISDPALLTLMDRPKVTCRQQIMLDLTESDPPGFDMGKGKNVTLNQVRAAVGQNTPRAWAPSMLEGQAAKVVIKHRQDPDDPNKIFSEVGAVTALR